MSRMIRAAAAVAAVAALAACAPEPVPTVEPVAEPTAPLPALEQEKLAEIVAEAEAGLVEADAASTGDALDARFVGPARVQREAEYGVAAVSAGAVPVSPLDLEPHQTIVNATFDWPRVAAVVSQIPEGATLRLLYTMVQENPRSDFKVWSWAELFPGVTLPQVTTADLGSRYVAPDDDSLLVSPTDLIARYADVVNNGDASEHAALFQADPFRAGWENSVNGVVAAVSDAGSATQNTVPSTMGTLSIGTADGGAIVTGTLDQTTTVQRTEEDSTLTVGPNLAYYGERDVVGSLTTTYLATVAFYVPPAGSDAQIQMLGAYQVLMGAERDDSTNPD